MQDHGTANKLLANNMCALVHCMQMLQCAAYPNHLCASKLSCGHTEAVSVCCMGLTLCHICKTPAWDAEMLVNQQTQVLHPYDSMADRAGETSQPLV